MFSCCEQTWNELLKRCSSSLCCAFSSTWKWNCWTPIDQVIRFTAPTTWYQNNFNLTRRSRTLAMGDRREVAFHPLFYPSSHMNLRNWFQEVQEQPEDQLSKYMNRRVQICRYVVGNTDKYYSTKYTPQVNPQGSLNFHLLHFYPPYPYPP